MSEETQKLCTLFKNKNSSQITSYIKENLYNKAALSYFHYYSLQCVKNNTGDVELAQKVLKIIEKVVFDSFKGTMTLTFGEVAESHVGMQKIGKMDPKGFSYEEIKHAQKFFKAKGCTTLLIHLNDFLPSSCSDEYEEEQLKKTKKDPKSQAWLLIVRNGLKCLTEDSKGKNIMTEMLMFEWDSKLYNERRKIVQNKLARHNLNFSDFKQEADFSHGKGTTISWNEVPLLENLKKSLIRAFGDAAKTLKCEGNLYYKVGKTGIGYHGDTERRKVIGVRLGRSMTIHYMWYYNDEPRGTNVSILLNEGDVYCMGEKTVGTDWRAAPKKQYTLRHSAGAEMYTTKTPKIQIRNMKPYSKNKDITVGEIWFKPKKSGKNPNPKWAQLDKCVVDSKELVIMVGYPGSGKSTYIESNFDTDNYTILRGDKLKTEAEIKKALIKELEKDNSVVLDATNASKKKRQIFIKIAKERKIPVKVVHITTSMKESMNQNKQRDVKVPDMAFFNYKKNFEKPSKSEGINEIIEMK